MNCFIFSGNLGRDGEVRRLQDGTSVVNFTVASKAGYGDRATTSWVDCALFGKRADALAQYLTKGTKVTVQGELRLEQFSKRDGTEGSKLSVRVAEIDLHGSKNDGEQRQGGSRASADDYQRPLDDNRRGSGGGGSRGGSKPAFDPNLDEEIPF